VSSSDKYIDKRQLLARVPNSYPTIWKRMKDGKFPKPRVMGGKNVWREEEVNAYLALLDIRDCYRERPARPRARKRRGRRSC
jgi:predicted DNA-binding transcriptional regulator AlpA